MKLDGPSGFDYSRVFVGAWLSLVERSVRDREVGGSNPLAPTTEKGASGPLFSGRESARGFEPPSGLAEAGLDALPNKTGDWHSQARFESRPDGSPGQTGRSNEPPSGLVDAGLSA